MAAMPARDTQRFAVIALLWICVNLAGCGGASSAPTAAPDARTPPTPRVGHPDIPTPPRFFAATSFWNTPVPTHAPLSANSGLLIATLEQTIKAEQRARSGPWINTTDYSVPVYTVPPGQPTVAVELRGHIDSRLSRAWKSVPLPPDAQPAAGSDGILVVWQPSTGRLWEFWRLTRRSGNWEASWGGAMRNVGEDSGVYGPQVWPGGQRRWGASASSLSLVGGLISLKDLQDGRINHALEMAVPDVRGGVFLSPAQRT